MESDSGAVTLSARYKTQFEAGDLFTLTSAMRHGAKIMRSYLDADNSANDWMSATHRYEDNHCPEMQAKRAETIRVNAERLQASAPTPKPRSEHDVLLERVTTTGSSGLGKARRKVSR